LENTQKKSENRLNTNEKGWKWGRTQKLQYTQQICDNIASESNSRGMKWIEEKRA
jgi:hypothetical protein